MSEEKRLILAGVLSLLVLLLWYQFFGGRGDKTLTPPPPVEAPVSSESISSIPSRGQRSLEVATTSLESADVRWVFTSFGAELSQAVLKSYRSALEVGSPAIDLIRSSEDEALSLLCHGCNFSLPSPESYRLVGRGDREVIYEAANSSVQIKKAYRFADQDGYPLEISYDIRNLGDRPISGAIGLSWKGSQLGETSKGALSFLKGPQDRRKFVYALEGKVTHGKGGDFYGPIAWAGIEERYFLIGLISRRVSSESHLQMAEAGNVLRFTLFPSSIAVPPGGVYQERFTAYLGPKDRKRMARFGVGLEKGVDFGFFQFFAIPILKVLEFFNSFAKNWGVAIILLTILVKLLLNPLSVKALKQMKEMQGLQPRLAVLKEKFKNDRQRLNMETMQLFKDHKVNPLGGCLPMLVQLPIYIALYNVLYNAVELYHAPFFWFYRDLSAPDPYFVLPILMGIFMVLQQKMTPSTSVDPVQRQMMMVMPILFSAFMIFLPAGLTLYFLVNSVMTVVQQYLFQHDIRLRRLFRA